MSATQRTDEKKKEEAKKSNFVADVLDTSAFDTAASEIYWARVLEVKRRYSWLAVSADVARAANESVAYIVFASEVFSLRKHWGVKHFDVTANRPIEGDAADDTDRAIAKACNAIHVVMLSYDKGMQRIMQFVDMMAEGFATGNTVGVIVYRLAMCKEVRDIAKHADELLRSLSCVASEIAVTAPPLTVPTPVVVATAAVEAPKPPRKRCFPFCC